MLYLRLFLSEPSQLCFDCGFSLVYTYVGIYFKYIVTWLCKFTVSQYVVMSCINITPTTLALYASINRINCFDEI